MSNPKKPPPTLSKVDLGGSVSPALQRDFVRQQFIVSMASLALGTISLLLGAVLAICGLTGAIQWSFSAFGLKSNLADAGPGALLCIVGLLIIALNRFSIKIRK
jgi:hypothetical protein